MMKKSMRAKSRTTRSAVRRPTRTIKKRRITKRTMAPKVSPSVKAYVQKAVDASNPDTHIQMMVKPHVVLRSYNGNDVSGQFNFPPRTDVHFFLHRGSDETFSPSGGMNIPEQIGLRHLEDRSNLDGLTLAQLTGNSVKLKSLYVKGRYIIDQVQMEALSVPELHIRTMCLEDKEKSYEEIVSEFATPLYEKTTSAGEVNPKAGILYKMFRDPSGYTTQEREDQENTGYLWPNTSKLCRAFPDMYGKSLPLNTASFKYNGGTYKKVKIADWKPTWQPTGFTTSDGVSGKSQSVYDPAGAAVAASSPYNGTYEVPFSFKIKAPQYLKWDNVHRRVTFEDVRKRGFTSGPQNFTPFISTFINSPNPGYTNKVDQATSDKLDALVNIEYKIYASIDAKPSI